MTSQIPDSARPDWLARGALGLAGVAFVASLSHVIEYVGDHRQGVPMATTTALISEIAVSLCILRLRRGARGLQRAWTILVLVTQIVFMLRGNLGDLVALGVWDDRLVAAWPTWGAIGAAGLIELSAFAAPSSGKAGKRVPATSSTPRAETPAQRRQAPRHGASGAKHVSQGLSLVNEPGGAREARKFTKGMPAARAAEIAQEMRAAGPEWTPDYPALQERWGCKLRSAENAVSEARRLLAEAAS